MDKQLLIWWFIHLILDLFNSWESSEAQGFSLNGTDYSNHSTVLRTDIGEGPDALLCTTDYIYCCYVEGYYASDGRFYFPNNTQVPALRNIGSSGYYKNNDYRVISLNRQSENGVLTGQFSCEIPIVNGYWYHYTISVFYINIVDMLVTISPSGLDIAGQNYTLLCAVTVTGSNDQPTITWIRDDGMEFTSVATSAVSMNSSGVDSAGNYSRTLMFSPLAASHAGTYTCRANLDDAQTTDSISVVVNGVYLSLNDVIYANNSIIPITEIGKTSTTVTSNTGLQCITDRRPCCKSHPNRYGQWLFPDGTTVPSLSSYYYYNSLFYRSRGDDGTVNLNRVNASVTMPTGQFCCMVHDATDTEQTICVDIVSIVITPSTAGTPTAGETYSLECSVNGTSDPAATYRWFDDSGTQLVNGSQLHFSPLRASDAGTYTCQATLEEVVVEGNATVNINFSAPADVRVTYPIREIIAGSSIDLNCTVELSPAVDVPVSVTTEWSGPARTTFLPNRIVPTDMINLTIYSSTITVDAAKNGSYTCTAIIDSGGITSGSTDITVAPLSAPTNLVATGMTTSIQLTWEQPEGSVDSYILDYEFSINQCNGNEGTVRKTISDGSLRTYTIVNSADTPVEEDSMYYITLRAVNSVDTSEPSNSARVNTRIAAPGPPPNLAASSVNVTSITIQWDPIPCQDRNRQFDFYRVFYYSIYFSGILTIVSASIREFTATALPPRTNCIFQVQAFDVRTAAQGSFANLIVNTSEPEEFGFLLNGQLYGNNSVVTVTDIGSSFFMSALFCLTPSLECCSDSETPNAASVTREWYLPNGRPVRYAGTVFSREQVSSAVSLYRSGSTSLSGVFRCEIPDASGASQNIYVGIYPHSVGFPSITSVQFDRNSTTLTCTSTGSPPATVTWKKNGVLVSFSLYEQSQRLLDAESATYENILYNDDVANFVGSFTCEIRNVRGTVEKTVELNGVLIVHDQFNIGESATATCTSDIPATRIEWIRNGVVFASAVFTQEVVLSISQVTDNIHGQVYVCRVTRNGGMVATQNFTVTVQVNVSSDVIQVGIEPSGNSIAGEMYALTCNVSVISGLTNSPSLIWTNRSGAIPMDTMNGITISTTVESSYSVSVLTFDPLRTSHGDIYTCDGTIDSPALNSSWAAFMQEILTVQISTPDVSITIPSGPLYAGALSLTLTCNISINLDTNSHDVREEDMDITWLMGDTVIWPGGRDAIFDLDSSGQTLFISQLTLIPLSTEDTTFTCRAVARPPAGSDFISISEIGQQTVNISVELPPAPNVSIVSEGSSTAGFSGYKLICNANKNPFLATSNSATLAVQWLDPNDAIISERNRNFTISGVGPTTNTVLTSRLTFNHLYTSQAGEYTCRTLLTIPGTVDNHTIDETVTVSVKLPPPESVRIALSREAPLYEGTTFSLTCIITPNRTGVDTGFVVNVPTFSGPGAPPRSDVTMDNMDFQTSLSFTSSNTLAMRNTGAFSCLSIVVSTHQVPNIDPSDATTAEVNIIVKRLTEPNVSIQAGSIPFTGQHHTLNCFASTEDYVVGVLTLNWVFIDSISGVTEGHQIDASSTTARRSLTFNPVRSSHAGQYTCRAQIVIPQADVSLTSNAQQIVSVQIPPPLVSIPNPLTTPYNGTVFTLTGRVIFNHQSSVDTPVTISTVWSSSSGLPEATSKTDDYSLTFQPIATNSSGTFTLTVTIQPSDNSEFIVGSSGNASYNLVVRALPSRPPNITIVSRHELDDCGEVMTLSCTAYQVENLFSPPAITWIAPDGSEVSTIESNNRQSDPETGELIFSDVTPNNNGRYTCRAIINIPEAQIDNYYDEDTVQVHANTPGIVQNLVCAQSSSPSVLSFSWDPPTPLGSEVVTISYQPRVSRLEHRPGTREVIQYDVYEKLVDTRVSEASVTGLVAEVPYNVTVKALNLAGCGEESQMYCFTQEGVPPPPENVVVKRFDSTSIGVSWTKFTLVELKGLADYIIAYNIIIDSTTSSRKRQTQLGGTMTVPWTQNHIIISGLQTGAEYNVTVRASTAAGISAPASPETAATPASSSSVNTLAIIGGAVAVVIVIVIAITVLIAIALALRSRRAEFSPNQKSLPYESPGSTVLSNQPPNDKEKEVYETVETDQDHEYEILDKFNQPRAQHHYSKGPPLNKPAESVQLQPLSSAGDYEFSQCPAYVSVATTSIHGNTAEHIYN